MVCQDCQTANREGARFCNECGRPLGLTCPACGAEHGPGQRFCDQCATRLVSDRLAPVDEASPAPEAMPTNAELRLVSVLFVDLVGYSTLSESRDAEEVRELLGRYFDSARTIVGRYGGVVGKFIGDAVMAVWGAPVAREDDAERAVRAGLEMVDAVSAFGAEFDLPGLRARGGIVTGQVAAMANPGEGLVVGDRVNAAARLQSVAAPGTVLVDQVTRLVTSAAISYLDAGERTVRGLSVPLRCFEAIRVVAGVGGLRPETGLEAPLIGRDADLRLLKELLHSATDRRTARLVAVSGQPGVGKSRLLREFENYADGLAETFLWHSGRCLAYGEGVAYWALAEMVRQRFGISEDAPSDEAIGCLAEGLDRWILDPADRVFLTPRLGALLGVAEPGLGREELFAGWRLFFERLATHGPIVMAFEDLQWADSGVLDFIELLLEWSAAYPIFIITLARNDLADRRAGWPASRRGVTQLQLDPLGRGPMRELLNAVAGGLPEALREQILDRAQGVPLYALETIRALIDRGVLVDDGGELSLVGEVGELQVPASLTSLLASRLDALDVGERELVKALSIFSGDFPRSAVVAVGRLSDAEADGLVAGLVRKQVLTIRADPLSPDRGQYGFAQTLLRTVAYEMLSRRERMQHHRTAAEHLRNAFPHDGEEVAEAIAAHYLGSYEAARGDADAEALRVETIRALRRAAQRAGNIGAPEAAERALCTAAELAVGEDEATDLTSAAGRMALAAGRLEAALALLDSAQDAHLAAGRARAAALVGVDAGRTLHRLGQIEQAIVRYEAALEALGDDSADAATAVVNSRLAASLASVGRYAESVQRADAALATAQAHGLPNALADTLVTKSIVYLEAGRAEEARVFLDGAISIAERDGLPDVLTRARLNSANADAQWDRPSALEHYEAALELSRRRGDRGDESYGAMGIMYRSLWIGRWDAIEPLAEALFRDGGADRSEGTILHYPLAFLHSYRGELEAARHAFERMAFLADDDDAELRALHVSTRVRLLAAEGLRDDVLEHGLEMLVVSIEELSASNETVRNTWPDVLTAAIEERRLAVVDALLALLTDRPPGHIPPFLRAQLARGQGLRAAALGEHDAVEPALSSAIDFLHALGYPYWSARVELELAEWWTERGRDDEAAPLLDQVRATFSSLGAVPDLRRAEGLSDASAARVGR